jgi:DnaK suppressor protein
MKKKKAKAKAKPKAKAKVKAKSKTKAKAKAKAKIIAKPKSILKRTNVKRSLVMQSISRKPVMSRPDRTPEEKPLSASEIQKFRDILTQKQEELSEIVHRKKEEQEFQQEEPEIGDEADIATRSVEKEILFDIADTEKQTLDRIEAALRKIEKGAYGRCESCQRVIPRQRLEVMPWARYDINCQAKNEVPSGGAVAAE